MSLRASVLARVLAAALIVGLVAEQAPGAPSAQAPAFQIRTLAGERLDSKALLQRGPIVLDFWATWCRPCERSLPALESLHGRYDSLGVTVLAISVDGPRNWTRVRPFVASHGLTMAVAIDEDGSLARRFRVSGVPTSVVIASDGRLVHVHSGYVPGDEQALEAAVREALVPAADSAR